MPTYQVKTLEKWHHFVTYKVEADSEDLAKEFVKNMEIEDYESEEYAGDEEDEIVEVWSVKPWED